MSYSTGSESTISHAVWRFGKPETMTSEGNVTHVLDLASMQFGKAGRAPSGEVFRLGNQKSFFDMVAAVAEKSHPLKAGSQRIGPSPDDDYFLKVARRVKRRWDARETAPWCDFCGKPGPANRCSACKKVCFCGPRCSSAGWGFHKKWCAAKQGKRVG